jgi:uncharacterized protein DUF6335
MSFALPVPWSTAHHAVRGRTNVTRAHVRPPVHGVIAIMAAFLARADVERQRRPTGGPMTFKDPVTLGIDEINDAGQVLSEIAETHPVDRNVSPELSGGDVDARWDEAESSGDEAVGGSTLTPDQDVVDEIGKAAGVTYQEGEPLRVGEKEEERDEHRWELDPASADDYSERVHEEAEAQPLRKMGHEHRQRH